MKDWYTRQEVADILGVSKATVYHYAKQGKIKKIRDPHRLIREARYQREEVDVLAIEREKNQPTGMRPAELAKKLNVPVLRIYNIIKSHNLPVDDFPIGDEMYGYSISDDLAEFITKEVQRTLPPRGTPTEFYNSTFDVALYQLFKSPNGQELRVLRNEENDWGFYLQSRTWVPVNKGITEHNLVAAYPIHQKNNTPKGYTDFQLPKNQNESFDFLDFVYSEWGIENIRLREHNEHLALSIKSGSYTLSNPAPETILHSGVKQFIVSGDLDIQGDVWTFVSGYRRTTIELPVDLIENVQLEAKKQNMTMSELTESILNEWLERNE